MVLPETLAPGTYGLRAEYLDRRTGAAQPLAVPAVTLVVDPAAAPVTAVPLRAHPAGSGPGSGDLGSEESDEDMSDLDEEEEEEEEDFCPPGCEPALFEQVCELREKRLDTEETLAEFQKAADTLKKDQEALTKKEKLIDQALKQTDGEIQTFQSFKQQKVWSSPAR
jgi:exonuclease VII small subunit